MLRLFETTIGIQFTIRQSLWDMKYHTDLLGGEFDNCHGQGSTPNGAINSLKIRVLQLRRKRDTNGRSVG